MPQVAIVMPKMSMTMTEGELLTWHVKPGDVISAGDVVCEVATDKIDMEVEATASGTVISVHGEPGDVMDVGATLVMVEAEVDDLLAGIFDAPAPAAPAVVETPAVVVETPAPATPVAAAPGPVATPAVVNEHVEATPKARAVAADLNVDLKYVAGTGAQGVIKHTDVENAAQNQLSSERTIEKRLKTRLAIARAIEASRDIPSFSMTFTYETSLTASPSLGASLTAWSRTLAAFPELHAQFADNSISTFPTVKAAISVMAAHGIVTPVVTIPTTLTAEFETELANIVENARRGSIALEYLTSSTTGFGDVREWPVTASHGILIRPQSTSIAVGAVRDGRITFTINADHRVSDPADVALLAARFVREIQS